MGDQARADTPVQVASEAPKVPVLDDGLGVGVLLGIKCIKFFDVETNASIVRILFSFSDESVTKFGDDTIEVPAGSVKEVFIDMKAGMRMRDICLGLSRLNGIIASSIMPMTTS